MWRRRQPATLRTSGGQPPGNPGDTGEPIAGESAGDDLTIVLRAMLDRREFAPLYAKYLTPIYRRCLRWLHDPAEAWDATGTTFHKALLALDGFQGGSFEGWLRRIADNACRDILKTRHPGVPFDEGIDGPEPGPDPEQQAIATMDRERLDAALRQLTPRRERIVRLHLAGLKGKEIAARLGISHDLVRKEQERALDHLADLLADPGDDRKGGQRDG